MNAASAHLSHSAAVEGRGWPVGLIRADRIGRVRSINAAAVNLLGAVADHAPRPSIFALLAAAEPPLCPRAARSLEPGAAARAVIRRADGARIAATLAREDDGGLTALLVDEGPVARAEAEAERQRARFEALADWAPQAAVWALDPQGRITSWPRSASRQFALPPSRAIGLSLARLLEATGVEADAGRLLAQAEADEGVTVAAPHHRAGLPTEDLMLTVRAARGADGALTGYVVVAGAATVASGREAALRRLAALDPLTGILNRRAFLAAAARAVEQRRRLGGPLSVIAFDVDRFKALNDAHGHAAGDLALQRVCEATAAALRPEEPFGRIGGDEFAIVLPGVALADAVAVAQRIGEAVAALRSPAQVTLSLGVVERRPGDELFAETLARADAALYRAKAAGRDRVAAA